MQFKKPKFGNMEHPVGSPDFRNCLDYSSIGLRIGDWARKVVVPYIINQIRQNHQKNKEIEIDAESAKKLEAANLLSEAMTAFHNATETTRHLEQIRDDLLGKLRRSRKFLYVSTGISMCLIGSSFYLGKRLYESTLGLSIRVGKLEKIQAEQITVISELRSGLNSLRGEYERDKKSTAKRILKLEEEANELEILACQQEYEAIKSDYQNREDIDFTRRAIIKSVSNSLRSLSERLDDKIKDDEFQDFPEEDAVPYE